LVAEVVEEALPEGAPEDAVFRLVLAVIEEMQVGRVWMPVTYFALWMSRLMGWMPELGRCVVCGRALDASELRGGMVWYSATSDGVTCGDDRRGGSVGLPAASVAQAQRMFRGTVGELAKEDWARDFKERGMDLRRFAVETLERHLERRLVSARALGRA
jgi:DNA repair protein RecO (recombination protein O)